MGQLLSVQLGFHEVHISVAELLKAELFYETFCQPKWHKAKEEIPFFLKAEILFGFLSVSKTRY